MRMAVLEVLSPWLGSSACWCCDECCRLDVARPMAELQQQEASSELGLLLCMPLNLNKSFQAHVLFHSHEIYPDSCGRSMGLCPEPGSAVGSCGLLASPGALCAARAAGGSTLRVPFGQCGWVHPRGCRSLWVTSAHALQGRRFMQDCSEKQRSWGAMSISSDSSDTSTCMYVCISMHVHICPLEVTPSTKASTQTHTRGAGAGGS